VELIVTMAMITQDGREYYTTIQCGPSKSSVNSPSPLSEISLYE